MKLRTSVMFGLALAAFTSWAQPSNDSLNMQRLGHYPVTQWGPLAASPFCNDIWGYYDSATQRELAIVGNRNGTLIANVTNPSQITNVLWVPGAPSVWRDIKTWGHYAYVVHDVPTATNLTDGLLIIDLDSMVSKKVRLPVPLSSGGVDTLRRATTCGSMKRASSTPLARMRAEAEP